MKIILLLIFFISNLFFAMESKKQLDQLDFELQRRVDTYLIKLTSQCEKHQQECNYHAATFCRHDVALIKGAITDLLGKKHPNAQSTFYATGFKRGKLAHHIGAKELQKKYELLANNWN
ncbi:MAG: hypothetical protein ACOYT8_01895 [Candidatus Dependentiae bacterium]